MVRVPTTQGRSVQVQGEPGTRFRYAEGRDFMGRALQEGGQALGQAARDWDAIEATYDEADALRIANEFSTYERERLKTGENAYLTTQGFNAGEGREVAVKDLETASENLLKGARSKRARDMAQRALTGKIDTAHTTIANHAVTQMRVARTEQRQAQMSTALTDAVDARGTDQFVVNLGVAQMALEQMAADMGWSPEKLAEESEAMISGVHGQVVLAIDSEDGEPTAALEYLDANKDMIGPELEAKLRNSLAPRVDNAWADNIVRAGELVQYLPGGAAPEGGDAPVVVAGARGGVATELAGAGYSAAVVAGFLGNFEVEGGYGGALGDNGTASGIAQWRHDRRENFRRQFGKEPHQATHAEQAKFVVWEMNNPGAAGMTVAQRDAILAARTPEEAAELIDRHYERSSGAHRARRAEHARSFFTSDAGTPGIPADPRLSTASMRSAVDAYVAANPGISEARKQALYAAADRAVADGRAERAQAEADVDRRVTAWLVQNTPGADDLTSMGQIPAAVLEGASPNLIASLQQRVQTANSRIQAREDAEAAARVEAVERRALVELESMSDDELLATDLNAYVGRADPVVLARKVRKQKQLQSSPGSVVSADKVVTATNLAAEILGLERDKDGEEWARLRGAIEAELMEIPTDRLDKETIRSIAVEQTQKVRLPGTGFFRDDRVYRYELEPGQRYARTGDAIPAGARAYLDRNFPNVSDAKKFEIFERARARSLEWTFK